MSDGFGAHETRNRPKLSDMSDGFGARRIDSTHPRRPLWITATGGGANPARLDDMSECPPWCRTEHRPPVDPDGVPIHSTTPAHVGGVTVTVEALDHDPAEVHVCGDGDYTPARARELAAALLAAADVLDEVLDEEPPEFGDPYRT